MNKTVKVNMPCGVIEVECRDINEYDMYSENKYGTGYKVLYSLGLTDIVYCIEEKKFYKGSNKKELKEIERQEIKKECLEIYSI